MVDTQKRRDKQKISVILSSRIMALFFVSFVFCTLIRKITLFLNNQLVKIHRTHVILLCE